MWVSVSTLFATFLITKALALYILIRAQFERSAVFLGYPVGTFNIVCFCLKKNYRVCSQAYRHLHQSICQDIICTAKEHRRDRNDAQPIPFSGFRFHDKAQFHLFLAYQLSFGRTNACLLKEVLVLCAKYDPAALQTVLPTTRCETSTFVYI